METRIAHRSVDQFLFICAQSSSGLILYAHKHKLWKSSVSQSDLDTLATKCKLTSEQYVAKLFDALSNPDEPLFQVSLDDSNSLKLTWSKEAKKGIRIMFGTFVLNPVDQEAEDFGHLVSQLLSHIDKLQLRSGKLELENRQLHQVGLEAVEKYEQLVSEVQTRELTIFTKCAELLNEKKRKINQLMTSIDASNLDMDNRSLEKVLPTANSMVVQESSSRSELTASNVSIDITNSEEDEESELLPKVRKTQKLFSSRNSGILSGTVGKSRVSGLKQKQILEPKGRTLDDIFNEK